MEAADPIRHVAAPAAGDGHRTPQAEFERNALAAAIEMNPTADIGAMTVVLNIIRAANRVQQDLEMSVYRPAGITGASFRVLFALRAEGELAPKALARLSSVSSASVSSVLNTLERYGYIERTRDPRDGRMVNVRMTPAGEAVLARVVAENNRKEIEWASILTSGEQAILAELLRKLLQVPNPGKPAT